MRDLALQIKGKNRSMVTTSTETVQTTPRTKSLVHLRQNQQLFLPQKPIHLYILLYRSSKE